jgi:hypothetical protein
MDAVSTAESISPPAVVFPVNILTEPASMVVEGVPSAVALITAVLVLDIVSPDCVVRLTE